MTGRKMLLAFFSICMLIGTMAFAPSEADAWLKVCNRTPFSVDVAIAYYKTDLPGRPVRLKRGLTKWRSQGWWIVGSRRCALVYGPNLTNRYYYVFARNVRKKAVWGGKNSFCTSDNKFIVARSANKHCNTRAGYKWRKFQELNVGKSANYIYTLTYTPPKPPRRISSRPKPARKPRVVMKDSHATYVKRDRDYYAKCSFVLYSNGRLNVSMLLINQASLTGFRANCRIQFTDSGRRGLYTFSQNAGIGATGSRRVARWSRTVSTATVRKIRGGTISVGGSGKSSRCRDCSKLY